LQKKKRKHNHRRWLVWFVSLALVGMICAALSYVMIIFSGQKYLLEHVNKLDLDEASIIYDADGNEAAKLFVQNRESVTLDEVPEKLREAFIATEDKRFATHSGIDMYSIGRALYRDIIHRSAVEGASTITQQLARNLFLTANKTFFRKAQEASIAIALENNFSKDQILQLYLNRIYFGSGAYGIKAAAKTYFAVDDLNKLTLAQMAALASIPKAPSIYAPDADVEKAKDRRGVVLTLMEDQGYISAEEKAKALDEELVVKRFESGSKSEIQTMIDYTVEEATQTYGLTEDQLLRGGYKIYTTMNTKAQKALEEAYAKDSYFQKEMNGTKMQSAMVIYDQQDGGVVAMIGGREYVAKGLNRATARRQPGSTFKPIIDYGPALEFGVLQPYSLLVDKDQSYGNYHPRNYNNQYLGEVTMFQALQKSMNQPAVWTLNKVGLTKAMGFAERLGITFDAQDRNLAIALGGMTYGVTPLQMARAYGAFASGGYLNTPHAIVKILDEDGRQVAVFKGQKTQVMSAQTSYDMTLLLQGVVGTGGTGVKAAMDRPVAGKTGSTQLDLKGLERYYRDIWFVGYTPQWTGAVWMGFDKTDAKHYVTSDSGNAAALFKAVMTAALAGIEKGAFAKPDGVKDPSRPPKAVTDLRAEPASDGRSVILSWSGVGDNASYELYRKGKADADYTMLLLAASAKMQDLTVKPGETYEYYVVAKQTGTDLKSDRSNVVIVALPAEKQPGLGLPQLPGLPGVGAPGEPGGAGKPPGGGSTPPPGIGLTPVPGTGGVSPGGTPGGGNTGGTGNTGGNGNVGGTVGGTGGGTGGSSGGGPGVTGGTSGGTGSSNGGIGGSGGITGGSTGTGTGTAPDPNKPPTSGTQPPTGSQTPGSGQTASPTGSSQTGQTSSFGQTQLPAYPSSTTAPR
jgi:penicillin-binding protein 2A